MAHAAQSFPLEKTELIRIRQEAMTFIRIGLYRYQLNGDVLFMDRGALRIFDLEDRFADPAHLNGRPISDFVRFDDGEKRLRELVRCDGRVRGYECAFQTLTGVRKWGSFDAYLVHDPASGEEYVQVICTDITDRRSVEEALRDSEEMLRATLESTADGILVADEKGRVTHFNRRLSELWNTPADVLLSADGRVPLERVLGDLLAPEAFLAMINDLYVSDIEDSRTIDFKDGRVFACYSCPLSRDGQVIGRVWNFRDVTSSKRAEEALRESEERFRDLFDGAPVAYHELDMDGRIARVNQTELQMLGYTAEEMLGRFPWEFVVEASESRRALEAKLKGEGSPGKAFERTLRRKDGGVVRVLIEDRILRSQDGRPQGIRSVLQDITDRKLAEAERLRLEAQMRQAQKLESLGVLAGGIAHDFNNLLMGILGHADLARLHIEPDEPEYRHLEQIAVVAQRAADLCKQMLAYSGKGTFMVQRLDLSRIVEEMTGLLQVSISKKAVLTCDFAGDLPPIEADASQVRQIVMNLITNASEAIGDESGTISVMTGTMTCDAQYLADTYLDDALAPGLYVFVEVSDTGKGMDDETKTRAFEPFFSTKFTGRGLGLAAVLGIVRGHHGALKIRSEPGKGTTFRILFPAAGGTIETCADSVDSVDEWQGTGTILVVDDEELVRAVAGAILEKHGFQVLMAEDGQQALDIFRECAEDISLVLLDMTMPHLSGEETYREMRRIQSGVRVVFSSGYNESEAVQQLSCDGSAGFIQKPYPSRDLIRKVRSIIGA